MTREEFGSRVNIYRVSKSMVQAELAAKIGLSRASVSNIENGAQCVTLDTINKIAAALEIPTRELLYSETLPVNPRKNGRARRLHLCEKCGSIPPATPTEDKAK